MDIQNVITRIYENHTIRHLLINDEPWFVAKDICDVLGLSDTNKALLSLEDYEKLTRSIFVSGQNRNVSLVSESGLYRFIFKSRKPEARKFQKWVTSVVLPSIRKTGGYNNTDQSLILLEQDDRIHKFITDRREKQTKIQSLKKQRDALPLSKQISLEKLELEVINRKLDNAHSKRYGHAYRPPLDTDKQMDLFLLQEDI